MLPLARHTERVSSSSPSFAAGLDFETWRNFIPGVSDLRGTRGGRSAGATDKKETGEESYTEATSRPHTSATSALLAIPPFLPLSPSPAASLAPKVNRDRSPARVFSLQLVHRVA